MGLFSKETCYFCNKEVGVNVNRKMYKILNLVMYNFVHY